MTTPTPGTIPALTPYQPGALPIASTVTVEIVDTTDAASAASYSMPLVEFVGKAASVIGSDVPDANDMIVIYRPTTGTAASCLIGNLGQIQGNLPVAGGTAQLLAKVSATNFAATWFNIGTFINFQTNIMTAVGTNVITVSIVTGAVSSAQLAANAVFSSKIATAAIFSSAIATNQVGNVQIRQGAGLSVIGNSSSVLSNVADIQSAANSGFILQVNAGATGLVWGSTFATLPTIIKLLSLTPNGVVIASTASTGTLSVAAIGTAGQLLIDQGTGSPPLWKVITGDLTMNLVGNATVGSGKATGTMLYSANGTSATWSGAPQLATSLVVGTTSPPPIATGTINANNFFRSLGGFKVIGSTSISTTTLATIPNFTAVLSSSAVYLFRAHMMVTAGSTGGSKVQVTFGGTVNTTVYETIAFSQAALVAETISTSVSTSITISTSAVAPGITISGAINVGATGGTLGFALAQQVSTTTATVLQLGTLQVWQAA